MCDNSTIIQQVTQTRQAATSNTIIESECGPLWSPAPKTIDTIHIKLNAFITMESDLSVTTNINHSSYNKKCT